VALLAGLFGEAVAALPSALVLPPYPLLLFLVILAAFIRYMWITLISCIYCTLLSCAARTLFVRTAATIAAVVLVSVRPAAEAGSRLRRSLRMRRRSFGLSPLRPPCRPPRRCLPASSSGGLASLAQRRPCPRVARPDDNTTAPRGYGALAMTCSGGPRSSGPLPCRHHQLFSLSKFCFHDEMQSGHGAPRHTAFTVPLVLEEDADALAADVEACSFVESFVFVCYLLNM
jgi:hypothetical protein